MKKTISLVLIAFTALAVIIQSCKSDKASDEVTATDSTKTTTEITPDPKCQNAPADWFAGKMTAVPDSIGPFLDSANTTDCDFHRWSWQSFLSLTRCEGCQKPPFEYMVQVDNDLNRIMDGNIVLMDSSQAGTKATLYDKNNGAIYYSISVNEKMYNFQKGHLQNFADSIGKLSNYLTYLSYPPGCLEIKTSWIRLSAVSNPENYYITEATLVTKGKKQKVKVGLLGMHIVGSVVNHPELIWATFEHTKLAPEYNFTAGSGYPNVNDTVSKSSDYVFYNATSIGNCPMNNTDKSPAVFTPVFDIYPLGMAKSFTSTAQPTTSDLKNNANITALNASVLAQLQKSNSVWQNYFYKGSTWLENPTPTSFAPDSFNIGNLTNKFLRGSRAISNITMETFAQLNYSGNYTKGSMNCFGCHVPADFKNGNPNTGVGYYLAMSHLFINALQHKITPKTAPTP